MSYKVTCNYDDGTRVDASNKRWDTEEEARAYAATVHPSRLPTVEKDGGTQHTPGPWTHEANPEEKGFFQIWADRNGAGFTVAEGIGDEANARLIAAAPELLKALEDVCACHRTFRNVPEEDQEWTSIDEDALRAGFAAIAKAHG